MSVSAALRITGLHPRDLGQLARKARRLGMTPAGYVKQLVEQDLAVSKAAEHMTFEEILGPGRPVDEAELDRIIDRVRQAATP